MVGSTARGMGRLESRGLMMRQKGILFTYHNEGGEVPYDGLCLDMLLPQNLITTPAANNIDDIAVNLRTEERHCAIISEGLG